MMRIPGRIAALALLCTAATGAGAKDFLGAKSWEVNPTLNERFTIYGGAAFVSVDATVAGTNKSTGSGGTIDLDDLGLDGNTASPLIGGNFRFGARRNWRINVSYFGSGGSGSNTVNEPFSYEDVSYNVGASVETSLDTDFVVAMFGWAPFKSEKYELGVGVGAHVAYLDTSFVGAGTINGTPVGSAKAESDTLAPLPNFWVYGGYAFTPKLSLQGSFGWLSLKIDDYDGEIMTAVGSLEYRPRERLGIGAGYRYISTDLTVDRSAYRDKYDVDYYGPYVYMSLGF